MADSAGNAMDAPPGSEPDGGPEIPGTDKDSPATSAAEVPDVPDPMRDGTEAAHPGGVPPDEASNHPVPGGDPAVPTGGDPTINA